MAKSKWKTTKGTSKGDWLQGSYIDDDLIYGYDGNDYLFGYNGNDWLKGGNGNDRLYGGSGSDLFEGGQGADYFSGGSGTDEVSYESAASGVSVNLRHNTAFWGEAEGDTFSSIENLPLFEGENGHHWIEEYCDTCGQCIRDCPNQAILEQPVDRENGLVMCTDSEKCFPYFLEHHGCSVCIKVCPFSRVGYDRVRASFRSEPDRAWYPPNESCAGGRRGSRIAVTNP